MSCSPGNPCYSIPLTSGCNVDPNTEVVSTDKIIYTGPNLSCIGVDTCSTVTESLYSINNKLCPNNLVLGLFSAISNNSPICTEDKTNLCEPDCETCIPDNTMTINCVSTLSVLCDIILQCTTTTTSTSTTTTTTTATPCYCYQVQSITTRGIAIQWIDCDGQGVLASGSTLPNGTYNVCAQEDTVSATSLDPYNIFGGVVPCTALVNCVPTTTTTTTIQPLCSEYEVCAASGNGGGFFQYFPCGSTNVVMECLDEGDCITVCVDNSCGIIPITNILSITPGIACISTTTSTTTLDCSNDGGSATMITTTTTTTTIACECATLSSLECSDFSYTDCDGVFVPIVNVCILDPLDVCGSGFLDLGTTGTITINGPCGEAPCTGL